MEYNRFGYEWSKYSEIIPLYEHQFRGWIYPLTSEYFKGTSVLDAGCGTGRNAYWAANYGASRVVAFDVDPRTVAVAQRNLGSLSNVKVVEGSIYSIPYEGEFDLAFSIGVIHHLRNPHTAVGELVKAVRKGGVVLIWVYAKEGYSWLKSIINAARKLTSRWPIGFLDKVIVPFSFVWFLYLRLFPHRHPYLRLLRSARFWHVHSILLDQLLPEVANYWTKEETLSLFDGLTVKDVRIEFRNKGSWTVMATKV